MGRRLQARTSGELGADIQNYCSIWTAEGQRVRDQGFGVALKAD